MALPGTVPAVEYRNLVTQLSLRRELDPDNVELLRLMRELLAIGYDGGALRHVSTASEAAIPYAEGAELESAFDWDDGELNMSPHQAQIVATVAEVTRIPE